MYYLKNMDEDLEESTLATQEGELEEVLLREQQRNAELKEYLSHLLRENTNYKKKYNELQERISGLCALMEKNARIFQELFDDSKSALQMGTFTTIDNSTLQSPGARMQNTREVLPRSNQQPGPSGITKTRTRMDIGRLDLKELEQSLEAVENGQNFNLQNVSTSPKTNEHLTTILEENTQHTSNAGALAKAKDVRVRLSRLPYEIVQEHLHKQETIECSVNLTTMSPNFTSTPLKLETMKGLGLCPSVSQSQHQFVNTRRTFKKENNENSPSKQKKTVQSKELKNLAIDTNEGKKIRVSLNSDNGRPTRRTRPQYLKEPNLKRKVRRS